MGLTVKELIPLGARMLLDGWRAATATAAAEAATAAADAAAAARDAEALLCFQTGFDRQRLFMARDHEVDDASREAYFSLASRRAAGEPLQYITGEQYFMGHRLSVNPDVLIPRPETEILAEKAIEWLNARAGEKAVLDLCTGSGALAIAIAKACPGARVTATDISKKALAVAMENARALGVATEGARAAAVAGRVAFIESDLFSSFGSRAPARDREFDLIVTNPPYIRTDCLAGLQREIRDHEPIAALDGGADGLCFYRRIAAGARAHMRAGACLMAETGHGQAQAVSEILGAAGLSDIETFRDLAGLDRIVKANC